MTMRQDHDPIIPFAFGNPRYKRAIFYLYDPDEEDPYVDWVLVEAGPLLENHAEGARVALAEHLDCDLNDLEHAETTDEWERPEDYRMREIAPGVWY